MNEVIVTQDISSGRVHKRYRMPGGQVASFEVCNLDDAGDYQVVAQEEWSDMSRFAPGDLCRNCWPEDDATTRTEP